jgi:hypothetical protein
MKLDAGVELWFAWKEGDSKKLEEILKPLLGINYTARLPSAAWKFYTEKNHSTITKAIMLSNEWSAYVAVTWTDSLCYRFHRNEGPPSLSPVSISYRNFVIVND